MCRTQCKRAFSCLSQSAHEKLNANKLLLLEIPEELKIAYRLTHISSYTDTVYELITQPSPKAEAESYSGLLLV